jgi:hypothetical protein
LLVTANLLRTPFRIPGATSSGLLETAGEPHGVSKELSGSAWIMPESPRPRLELAKLIASLHILLVSDYDILD